MKSTIVGGGDIGEGVAGRKREHLRYRRATGMGSRDASQRVMMTL